MSAADELLRHRDGEIRAATLSALSADDLLSLGHYAAGLSKGQSRGCRLLGTLLESVYCGESHRRQSGGAVELASVEIPEYMPGDLASLFNSVHQLSYEELPASIGSVIDEIGSTLLTQVNAFLVLLQGQIEARSAE